MDMEKVGAFLAFLRRERGLTQEALGERLGVTNKTVSRWENGNYLPPVEMLKVLSEFYGVCINELLSGERLTEDAYRKRAEENITEVLRCSSFTWKEKLDYFKRKWKKDHIFVTVLGCMLLVGFYVLGAVVDPCYSIVAAVGTVWFSVWRYNRMMAYAEEKAFDGSGT